MAPNRKMNVTYVHDETLSEIAHVEVNHTWDITNFSRRKSAFSGTEFCSELDETLRWQMDFFPLCETEEAKTMVKVRLYNFGSLHGTCYTFELSILKRDGSKHFTRVDSWDRFTKESKFRIIDFIERDVLLDKVNELLRDDTLTLLSKISLTRYTEMSSKKKERSDFMVSECKIISNLKRLHDTQMASDVTLSTGDGEVRAHKAILMARSPVFAAMFNTEMQEKNAGLVTITDTPYKVLREVVRFMYTGERPEKDEMTSGLFVAADKYNLEHLKEMCEESLSSTVSTDSAAELLVLADRQNAQRLKSLAMEFITAHSRGVMETEGWKALVESQPHLFSEVLESMADLISSMKIS